VSEARIFRGQAGYLGSEQQLLADAAVDIFLRSDLRPILQNLGNRGYRAVASRSRHPRRQAAAYARHLGATGLTLYDDVIGFFSPQAEGKSAIFPVALGNARNKTRGD
jgi:hypothetical protein